MKNLYIKLCLLALSAFFAQSLHAYNFAVDGIYYSITSSTDKTVEVTYKNTSYNSYSGSISIPSTVYYSGATYTVASIGDAAFWACGGLTNVTIPSSVTSIGSVAFGGCTGLTSITIPSSVKSIGSDAFYGCTGLTAPVFNSSIFAYLPRNFSGEYSIPEGIKQIVGSAFSDCTGLTSITIPSSVTSIGNSAFYGCSGLTSITIPSSVTSIDNGAFWGCKGLTSISIPSSVTSIGSGAFRYCTGLTSVTIPSSVTSIGSDAFYGCTGLTSITIPSSVTSIGSYAFYGCTSLKDVIIYGKPNIGSASTFENTPWFKDWYSIQPAGMVYFYNIAYKYKGSMPSNTSLTIKEGTTQIAYEAFKDCTGLKNISIPSSVTSIGSYAFRRCTGLTSITIPSSVTSIGNSAFYDCTGLTSITIPSSVTSIGSYAFSYCTGLTSVTIPSSVTSIGSGAFSYCTGLTSVTIPSSVTSIGSGAFKGCTGLTSVTIPSSVTSIDSYAFYGCSGLTSIIIPASVESINDRAFCGSGLWNVTIQGDPYIDETAFENTPWGDPDNWIKEHPEYVGLLYKDNVAYKYVGTMPANTSIIIKEGTTKIAKEVFKGCTGLVSIVLPSSISEIDTSAFEGCTKLKKINIPSSVTTIGLSAFSGCTNLTYVEINSNNIVSQNRPSTSSLKSVFGEQVSEYVLGESIVDIGKLAFYGCSKLIRITIPSSVNTIGADALSACSNLSRIYTNNESHRLFYIWNKIPNATIYDIETRKELPKPTVVIAANTATSLVLKVNCCTEIKTTILGLVDDFGETHLKEGNTIAFTGLRPNAGYRAYMKIVNEYNDEYITSSRFYTSSLTLTTAQPKVISAGNVLVSAETNIDPAETNVGFEWRRTDWTDDFASNTGKGYVNGESMEGKIKNLYTEKLWKYRPYYQSSDSTYYYGDWVGIDPTNTSWFEPTVHTYADFSVDGNTVLLKGYTLSGTDNVTEQGFKYWKSGDAAAKGNSAGVTVDAASVPADAQTVAAAGELMSAELTGLDYNSVYYYAAYVKTSTGETFYGEQRSFTIGDNPTGIIVVKQDIEEESQTLSTRPVMAGWFTLDGRKLQSAPTRSGIYIHNGRKVSVK